MKKIFIATIGVVILIAACTSTSLDLSQFGPTATPQPPTVTATVTPTFIPTETFTPSPTPTPEWVKQGPGDVDIPILLYHHIGISPTNSRYYVTPEKFEQQLKLLRDWGYASITTEMLVRAIVQGAELPPHSIIITFDDGDLDCYHNAFPLMQKYGFTGVLYIVRNYVGAEGYLTVDQILEMYHAGWEVGSHSMSHADLTTLNEEMVRKEIVDSRKSLEELLGIPIQTFAYPFVAVNDSVIDYVRFAGYIGAMGAGGPGATQGLWDLYYLHRSEVQGKEDAKTFTRFLPWQGDSAFLPTDTPAPTPSPTSVKGPWE